MDRHERRWLPRDHPRSRGVYCGPSSTPSRRAGSSPLARGLRPWRSASRRAPRIIPARAGFTYGRGTAANPPVGSSPLARGLRLAISDRRGSDGIIPARAGFTRAQPSGSSGRPDHPRSRGVYLVWRLTSGTIVGSSPLARGLRSGCASRRGRPGIIPARAGFTRRAAAAGGSGTDHPRSRGVYEYARGLHVSAGGSSPLARGLPPCRPNSSAGCGIIPARAGFTPARALPCPGPWDHPRSRGVYIGTFSYGANDKGSSPLARGLLRSCAALSASAWIIPARAGFTRGRQDHGPGPGDHPRSRGVYPCGSLVSQRTRSLPDPRRLHCRPRARSAGSP